MFENPVSIRTKKQNILNEKIKPFRRYFLSYLDSLVSHLLVSTRSPPCTHSQALYSSSYLGLFPKKQQRV